MEPEYHVLFHRRPFVIIWWPRYMWSWEFYEGHTGWFLCLGPLSVLYTPA